MNLATKIKVAKTVSRFTREARLGLALEVSEYTKIARSMGFGQSWMIGQRAYIASLGQVGNAPKMTWRQDAAWTKF